MSKTNAAAGVCSACEHDTECIYEAISGGVFLQCEQFELASPAPVAHPTSAQAYAFFRNEKETNGYAGLCSNCDNRSTCIYPKPEGGVWRCDEYV